MTYCILSLSFSFLHCYKNRCKIPTYMVDVAGPNNRADGIFQHVYFCRDSGHFQHILYPQWNFTTLSNMNIGIFQ